MTLDRLAEEALKHHAVTKATRFLQATQGTAPIAPLAWLNQRVAIEFEAPDLTSLGYTLVAKDRIASDTPVVRLSYRRADGRVTNLFLAPRWENGGAKIERSEADGIILLRWLDGPLAVALTTAAPDREARALAATVRQAIAGATVTGSGHQAVVPQDAALAEGNPLAVSPEAGAPGALEPAVMPVQAN